LKYWEKAKIINTLTKTNIYVLSNEPSSNYDQLDQDFTGSFPNFRFDEILERFSKPRTLGEHVDLLIPSLQRDLVDVVIWLLQRDLLVQLHTYVFLIIPHIGVSAEDKDVIEDSNYPSYPIPLRPFEISYLERISERGLTFQLFQRLCPYFRGGHHIEEIMWRENITREELMKVLEKYQALLVTYVH